MSKITIILLIATGISNVCSIIAMHRLRYRYNDNLNWVLFYLTAGLFGLFIASIFI